MEKHPNLISPHHNQNKGKPKVLHRIENGSNVPIFSKPRQLVKGEFSKLQRAGIISPSKLEWSLALHMIFKSDETYRLGGDYTQLNSVTKNLKITNLNLEE